MLGLGLWVRVNVRVSVSVRVKVGAGGFWDCYTNMWLGLRLRVAVLTRCYTKS